MASWSSSLLELRWNHGSGRKAPFPSWGEASEDFFTGDEDWKIFLKQLRYLRSVQGGAREAASTTERLIQVNSHKILFLTIQTYFQNLFFAKTISNLPSRPPCNALRRWFPSCTNAWKLTTTRESSVSRLSRPRFHNKRNSEKQPYNGKNLLVYLNSVSRFRFDQMTKLCSYLETGWQKLCEGTKGLSRKVWTQTKILSPNICYFVAISRFVAIYAFFGNLLAKNVFLG